MLYVLLLCSSGTAWQLRAKVTVHVIMQQQCSNIAQSLLLIRSVAQTYDYCRYAFVNQNKM